MPSTTVLNPGDPGTCTWTWDGEYWTCDNNCGGKGNCTDVAPDSTAPGKFVDAKGIRLVSASGLKIKATFDTTGKIAKLWVPNDIFQGVAKARSVTAPAVTLRTAGTSSQSVTTKCV